MVDVAAEAATSSAVPEPRFRLTITANATSRTRQATARTARTGTRRHAEPGSAGRSMGRSGTAEPSAWSAACS